MKTNKFIFVLIILLILFSISANTVGYTTGLPIEESSQPQESASVSPTGSINSLLIDITPEKEKLVVPEIITISVRIENTCDNDLKDIIITNINGNELATRDILLSGENDTIYFEYNINQVILDSNEPIQLTFTWNEDIGTDIIPREKIDSFQVKKAAVSLSYTRTANKMVVKQDQNVDILHELYNDGDVDLNNVGLYNTQGTQIKSYSRIPVGAKETYIEKIKITQDYVSAPKVLYTYNKAPGGKMEEIVLEPITIQVAKPNLIANLSVPKTTAQPDELIFFTCTIENKGNVTLKNIKILDDATGNILDETVTELKPNGIRNITAPFTFVKTQEFKYRIIAQDSTGEYFTFHSNTVTVDLVPEAKELKFSINITVSPETLTTVGDVSISILVTNEGKYEVSDIKLMEKTLGEIATIDKLVVGAEKRITYIVKGVSESKEFEFSIVANDIDGVQRKIDIEQKSKVEFDSADTTTPIETTEAPSTTVTPTPTEGDQDETSTGNLFMIILFIIIGLILLAAGVLLYISYSEKKIKPAISGKMRRTVNIMPDNNINNSGWRDNHHNKPNKIDPTDDQIEDDVIIYRRPRKD